MTIKMPPSPASLPPQLLMRFGEMSFRKGCCDGDFATKQEGSTDFGELTGFADAGAVHELQAFLLGGEFGAAAYGAYNEVGQGYGNIEFVGVHTFHAGNAHSGLGNAGYILAGGHEQGGESVGEVSLSADGSALDNRYGAGAPVFFHGMCGGFEHVGQDIGGQDAFGRYFFATHGGERQGAGFFVAGIIAFHEPVFHGDGALCGNVLTNGVGADGDHVLAGSIAGEVFEGQDHVVAFHVQLYVGKLAVAGFALGDFEKSCFLISGPNQETNGIFHGMKAEQGAAAYPFGEAGAGYPAGSSYGFGAAVVGGYKGAFCGG